MFAPLNPLIHFTQFPSHASGNHQSVLCIHELVFGVENFFSPLSRGKIKHIWMDQDKCKSKANLKIDLINTKISTAEICLLF